MYKVGRGVLSALGVEFKLKKGDIAARLNFCTLDENGKVADRRAGRISTGENQRILKKVKDHISTPPGIELFLETVSEHRVLMVLRGEDLDDDVPDTDPQETNVNPIDPTSGSKESKTAKIVKELLNQVKDILKDESKANFFLARGFAQLPNWPSFKERYKLNPAAVAGYPMYRGVSRLLGIPVVYESKTANEVCKDITRAMKEHTFVFGHFKYTDKTGEDGDLAGKIKVIEEMDQALSILLDHKPDVLIVTGDHSTPPSMKAHSWHPVPVLLHAPYTRHVKSGGFNEKSCLQGEIGTIYAKELLPLAMAHATKLQKYGA
ncbi:MAG: phosphoglycerate mutase [Bacteroidota bacterium]